MKFTPVLADYDIILQEKAAGRPRSGI